MLLLVALGILLTCTALTPWLERRCPRFWTWASGAIPLGLAVALLVQGVQQDVVGIPWASRLGLELGLRLDGLALVFALVVTGVGAAIMPYAGGYLDGAAERTACRTWLWAFMAAMLGLVLSDNLVLLYVCWELTGIASFMLIGIRSDPASRRGAQQALLITAAGGLALLVGLLLLAQAGGSWSLAALLTPGGEDVVADPHYPAILALVLVGAATKSALLPFCSWLPQAMAAPTPVSAYLHSATMVTAGIYLLARLQPVLGGDPAWTWSVGLVGGATALWGTLRLLPARDLKALLAWSTVAALGLMALLLAFPSPEATTAALAFFVAHALYKATMFMVAGSLDHGTGERDATRLRGAGRALPATWSVAILGGLSLAGAPPLLGFVGKEQLIDQALHAGGWPLATVVATAGAGFTFAALVTAWEVFAGEAAGMEHEPQESGAPMLVGMTLLALAGVVYGLWPGGLQGVFDSAIASLHPGADAPEQKLWHGFTPALALSALALVVGIGCYLARGFLRRARWLLREPGVLYRGLVAATKHGAWAVTRVVQNGNLRRYLAVVLLATTIGTALGLATTVPAPVVDPGPIRVDDAIILLVLLGGAGIAAFSRSPVGAAVGLSAMGTGAALVFVAYSAPDLALAQILADVLTVILVVLVFRGLPPSCRAGTWLQRGRPAIVALLGGGVVTLLLLQAGGGSDRIAEWYRAHAYEAGHGRNIVNVILVDFRALDTLGEITVLGLAAVGALALLTRWRRAGADDAGSQGEEEDRCLR